MRSVLLLMATVVLGACAALPRHPAPLDPSASTIVPNIPNARYWGDEAPANLDEYLAEIFEQRRAAQADRNVTMLALSGGADNGAFGAGLLNAWTETGTRPEFTVVTGVSTGALSAPFAFLGPDYDDELRQIYGGFPRKKILRFRTWFDILPKASIADSAPLASLIRQFADEELLSAVAREHLRGRRLFVQTTNLDAQRPVIWDLGAIATSGAPNALEVFRKALLASSSVPVAFPPVLIDVESEGAIYDEMHVDGGVVGQATALTAWQIEVGKRIADQNDGPGSIAIYVIRNGKVTPEPEVIDYKITDVAGRSVSTLIKSQSMGDLLSTYVAAEIQNADYHVTWIGEEFNREYTSLFDSDYMRELFDYGFDLMKEGKAWAEKPPILMGEEERTAMIAARELRVDRPSEAAKR